MSVSAGPIGLDLTWRATVAAEHSASAAELANQLSELAQWIAGIGIVFVIIGLWLNRRSMSIVGRGDRAYVMLHTTKRITRSPKPFDRLRSERSLSKRNELQGHGAEVVGLLGVSFKNFGRTPGFLIDVTMDLAIADAPPDPLSATTHYPQPPSQVVPVDGEWPFKNYFALKNTDVFYSRYKRGDGDLFLFGTIRYRDVYGREHKTWLSRRFDGRSFVFSDRIELSELISERLNGFD